MSGEGIDDGDYDCDDSVDDFDDDLVVRLRIQNTFPLSSGLSSLAGGQPSQSAVHRRFVMCLDRRVQRCMSIDETWCAVLGRTL